MDKFPEIVNIKLTSKCNHNCKYCYDSKKPQEIDFPIFKKIIKLLCKGGVKGIVLTGGEPLIIDNILKVFKEIKKYNINIYLDTNGDFWEKYKDEINEYVDILGLPLDYSSNKFSYRSPDNFKNVIKILDYYSKTEKRPKIKIGTVITKENIHDIKNIAELLKNYKIDSWKIYQFIPIGPNATSNQNDLLVDVEDFEKAISPIAEEYSKYFKIIPSNRKSRKNAYFFMNPQGTVFIPSDDDIYKGDMDIGHVFDKDIIEKWKQAVHKQNYIENAEKTFGHKFNQENNFK